MIYFIIAILGYVFFKMYLVIASASFDTTYVTPVIIRLENLAKSSNLSIDYNSYRINKYSPKINMTWILMAILPLVCMLYIAYYFENTFVMIANSIFIIVIVSSIYLMLAYKGRQRRFMRLFTDLRSHINIEGIDDALYKSIKRFQTFQMLIVIIMIIAMLSL